MPTDYSLSTFFCRNCFEKLSDFFNLIPPLFSINTITKITHYIKIKITALCLINIPRQYANPFLPFSINHKLSPL